MKIGVFDSGLGGQSVANAIQKELPELEILLRDDKKNVPYGLKSPNEILGFVSPIFESMINEGCQVIVVACNTVTTTLIKDLRNKFTIPLVAIEPMVKPASEQTASKIIAVCATPATLNSDRYKWLKQEHASGIRVIEPDCSDWSAMIEAKQVDQAVIAKRIETALALGADVIVLGCTHYHWIEEEIKVLAADKAVVLQPEEAIIAQLKRVIAQFG